MKQARAITVIALLFIFTVAAPVAAEVLYGLTVVTGGSQRLITFDSASPNELISMLTVSGTGGQSLIGIDFRPADGLLYGVSSNGTIYVIDIVTGGATSLGSLTATLSGTVFGIDFNPVADALRIVSNTDQNLRHSFAAGTTFEDGPLAYAAGDPNVGQNPNVVGSAYTNNFLGATTTTLYGIDSFLDILVIQNPPNAGTLGTVGPLGFNATQLMAFDISGTTSIAYAALQGAADPEGSILFRINLQTGSATLVGIICCGGIPLTGLSAAPTAPVPEPATLGLLGVGLVALAARHRRRRYA